MVFNATGMDNADRDDDIIPLTTPTYADNQAQSDGGTDVDLDVHGVIASLSSSSSTGASQYVYQQNGGDLLPSASTAHSNVPRSLNSNIDQTTFVAPSTSQLSAGEDPWFYLQLRFAHLWQRVPASWYLERDPSTAFRHVMTLFGFLSLCIFVFSVPYILHVVSPRAPTPPGTAPPLDEAASTVSGKRGAVAADVPRCSDVGVHVLKDLSGNAVDAAVAAVLCQGVLAPFASGLGGGAIALVHSKKFPEDIGISRMYDAREAAPARATMELYNRKNVSVIEHGGLAVAIPGELRGLYRMHTDFGKLPWKDVVLSVVEVAQSAKVGQFFASKLKTMNDTILKSPTLRKLFTKKVLTSKGQNQQDAAAAAELPGFRQYQFPKIGATDRATINNVKEKYNNIQQDSASLPAPSSEHGNLRREFESSFRLFGRHLKETADNRVITGNPRKRRGGPQDGSTGSSTPSNGDADGATTGGVDLKGTNSGGDNETHVIQVLEEGDELKNDALVETLRAIALHGPDALYHNLSSVLASEVQAGGGVLSSRDFRSYDVKIREVVESTYQGFTILGASPPSSGGASIAMALNMITHLEFRKKGRNAYTFRLLVECMKWVFGAAMGIADPTFVPASHWQLRSMLSRREALRRAFRIDPNRTYPPGRYAPGISTSKLQSGTSHVSVVDANGTAVSISSSINLPFGSHIASESAGFVYNDAMHAFTTDTTRASAFGLYPTTENVVEPGKRPATAACPTIVLRGRHVYLSLGGSGGPKAITGVLQTLLNILDFGDTLADAISAPRFHHQLIPNVLQLEAANASTCTLTDHLKRPSDVAAGTQTNGWSYWSSVCEALKEVGHLLDAPQPHSAVQAILVPEAISDDTALAEGEEEGRIIYAASDHRRIGKAAAY